MRLHRTLCNKWIAQDDPRHKQAVTLLIRALAVLLYFAELRNKVHAELKSMMASDTLMHTKISEYRWAKAKQHGIPSSKLMAKQHPCLNSKLKSMMASDTLMHT